MTVESHLKLNLGCGGRPLSGYVNIDMDTLEEMRLRYPDKVFDDELIIEQFDLFNLPYADLTVDEVRSDGLIEHLPFIDEPKFFYEAVRVLRPGGKLQVSTVDFEKTILQWLEAKDDWKGFFKDDAKAIAQEHWFGTYTYEPKNRWGYLTASFYGSQNGKGQFHTNCYSEKKLIAIAESLGLKVDIVEKYQWQGNRDHMLRLIATKL